MSNSSELGSKFFNAASKHPKRVPESRTTCVIIHQDGKKEEPFHARCIPVLGKYCSGFIDWFS